MFHEVNLLFLQCETAREQTGGEATEGAQIRTRVENINPETLRVPLAAALTLCVTPPRPYFQLCLFFPPLK